MGEDESRSYTDTVDYLRDGVGLDPERDVMNVAIIAADTNTPVDLQEIGGVAQTGADLMAVLESTADDDEFRIRPLGLDDSGTLQETQAEALDTGVAVGTIGRVTYLARALSSVGEDNLMVDIPDDSLPLSIGLDDTSITLPVDVQDSLEKKDQNYGADISAEVTSKVQLDGYSTAEVLFKNADSTTTVTVEKSWDDSNWFAVDSESSTADYEETFTNVTAKYIRLTVAAAGSGDTADIVVAGTA